MKTMPGKITPAINAAVFRALPLFLPLAAALFFASCSQDDIFYQVEYETKLRDPLIEGGPGQLVKFNDALYVASGSVWTYPDSGGGWRKMSPQPPGIKILDIAATTKYLYAVTNNGVSLGDSGYWRLEKGGSEWKSVQRPSHPYPNAIYGTDDTLFVAAASGSYYAVYALNDNPQGSQFSLIRDSGSQGKGMLMGAVKW
ncbi:MAG: hypothetical protein LBH15_00600, partial [Treponema sp.]|nr:hypothetical protein [Treponema sp.]